MRKKWTFIIWQGGSLNRLGWMWPGRLIRTVVPNSEGYWSFGWSSRTKHRHPSIVCNRDKKRARLCQVGDCIITDQDGNYFRDLEYLQKFKT